MTKPVRYLGGVTKPPGRFKLPLVGVSENKTVTWGSDAKSQFVDVISIGPITSIDSTKWDGLQVSSPLLGDRVGPAVGPFTHEESSVHFHKGDFASRPWSGEYPYVERAVTVGTTAEIKDQTTAVTTDFTRQVSGKGVIAIRLMFNTSGYTQSDDEGRRRHATAYFRIHVLDESGTIVKTASTSYGAAGQAFYCKNPTSIPLTIKAPDGYEDRAWQYKVEMSTTGRNYGAPVSGGWSAAIATEIYNETQWYDNVAYCSGEIVSSDVSGSIPERTYLVRGYQVAVPVFVDVLGVQTFLGEFTNETSNSHAWNILAILTDNKWAGDLPIDKINMSSFLEFEDYCSFDINGERRHTFSQHLIKATNYFKLASQIAGTADAKLYEDTSGRVGILVDGKTDDRRVITSYDIVDEKVKRTTVPNTKKLNYVQVEFEDQDNEYNKTVIHVEDSAKITENGIIKKEIKLDTVTIQNEADRIASKVLAVSQFISDTYHLTVGPAHEDLQIGDILEVYDRKHSNVQYCGKIGAGSTTTVLNINPATPIDLADIENIQMDIAIWTGTEVLRGTISTWTSSQIILTTALSEAPVEFLSFGVSQLGDSNLSPTLMKVVDLTDSKTGVKVSCVSYNHSLYDYVESGTGLIIPEIVWLPDNSAASTITSLALLQSGSNLRAVWDVLPTYNYAYRLEVQQQDDLGVNEWVIIEQGQLPSATTQVDFPFPLNSGLYRFVVSAVSFDGSETGVPASVTYELASSAGGTLLAPDSVGVFHTGDPDFIDQSYTGRDFTIGWIMADALLEIYEFRLTLVQNSISHTVSITDPLLRQFTISERDLADVYGIDFERSFLVDIFAIDINLNSGPSVNSTITNDPPPAPSITIRETGDVSLSTGSALEDDVSKSIVAVWESSNIGSVRPDSALVSRSDDLLEHTLSGDFIVQDSRDYIYEVAWGDTFGDKELNYTRSLVSFNPNFEIPDVLDITQVTPITETSILLRWSHDLVWLINMKVEYRVVAEDLSLPWTEFATTFIFPLVGGETDRGYDSVTDLGYVEVTGLSRNTLYEFRARSSNTGSPYSAYSNVIEGSPLLDITAAEEISDLIDETLLLAGLTGGLDIDPRDLLVEGVLDAFVDYESTTDIFEDTVVREDENQKRIDSIDVIHAELDDPVNGVYAQIAETNSVLVETDAAFAARVIVVDASTLASNANITTNATAITDEASARATDISLVNARVGDAEASVLAVELAYVAADVVVAASVTQVQSNLNDATADITTIQQASVTTNAAVATNASNLTAEVGDRIAEVSRLDQAVVDESGARSSADVILTTDVATARSEALAAIGYCEITPGVISNHETKAACELATGTWVEAPLAQAVNNVEVIDGVGGATTVGSFYETYITLEGEVVGQATLGVDGNGVFTGINIVSGASYNDIIFKAGGFEFQDSTGATSLKYVGGQWEFSGNLLAASGTFIGSMTAGTININSGEFSVTSLGRLYALDATVDNLIANGGASSNAILASTGVAAVGGTTIRAVHFGTSGDNRAIQAIAKDGPNSWAITAQGNGYGVWASAFTGGFAYYASNIDGGGTYAPFTGSHEGLLSKDGDQIHPGDIVVDYKFIAKDGQSDAICEMKVSTMPEQKTARGVFIWDKSLEFEDKPNALRDVEDEEFHDYISKYTRVAFNALGEGSINVCGENGNISMGDLITTSSMQGKGMLQTDQENLRPFTVAQAREAVIFSSPDDVKKIAVIYKCG